MCTMGDGYQQLDVVRDSAQRLLCDIKRRDAKRFASRDNDDQQEEGRRA